MKRFLVVLILFSIGFAEEKIYFSEKLHSGWQQTFEVDKWLLQKETPFQKIKLFENPLYGKVLVLDDIVQITEKDEFVYQEMLAHVPLLAHGKAEKVLIIGGGDGGVLREILKHKTVKKASLIEIDGDVIEVSKKYMPEISDGAFDNPRADVMVADGIDFVKKTDEMFDVVIVDTTDPVGPGEVLFSKDFFQNCKRVLKKNGILAIQNGVFFLQKEELEMTKKNLIPYFKHVTFYTAAVPSYVGGSMAFGFATDNFDHLKVSEKSLKNRLKNLQGALKYYTPQIHTASFALPLWVENYIAR